MHVIRRQPPAHSPLELRSVLRGLRGAVREPAALRRHVVDTLCAAFAAHAGVLLGSGTAALRLALAGVRATVADRPIAVPAYCCYDMATAADGADANVVLYDVDPRTLGPEESSLRRALERQPVAVVVAHLYGYPVDMNRIAELSSAAGVVLIEDAAQAAGGAFRGSPLGSFGSLTILSFGRGKGMTAGAGGVLLGRDELGAKVVSWADAQLPPAAAGARDLLALAAQWALGRPGLYGLPAALPFLRLGETVYHDATAATALSSCSLGALSGMLTGCPAEVERRRLHAERLLRAAQSRRDIHHIELVRGASAGYLRLPLRVRRECVSHIVRQLGRHGVARAYPAPLSALHSFASRITNSTESFRGANELAGKLVTFPTHGLLQSSDLAALESWMSSGTAC